MFVLLSKIKFSIVLSVILILQIQVKSFAQNLVPNHSFENYIDCPSGFSNNSHKNYVEHWESFGAGTPDYFNSCSKTSGVPQNWAGYTNAFHGSAYMGVIACMQQIDDRQIGYREYIKVNLKDTLQAGVLYYASMQIRLGQSSIAACSGVGMFFAGNSTNFYQLKSPQIQAEEIERNKENWSQLCGTFEAKGGECFLIIGNFQTNADMQYYEFDPIFVSTKKINPMAYYYVDGVELYLYSDTLQTNCKSLEKEQLESYSGKLEVGTKMVLENLYFKTDKSDILPQSYPELDLLAYELGKKPAVNILIFGHTDNTGNPEHNQVLSNERANAVRNYLISKGVSELRIFAEGFGAAKPVESNQTSEGRKQNRRVEIKVVER